MDTIKNKYYFTALDNFPYNMEECIEALQYALSYDSCDVDALCLMGRVYSELLTDYETAKLYFQEAINCDVTNLNTPKFYIKCLLDNEDFAEAEKLINYSLNIKGIDKTRILLHKSLFFEIQLDYENALIPLKEAIHFSYDKEMLDYLKQRQKFIKSKMPKIDKEKKSKKVVLKAKRNRFSLHTIFGRKKTN
ncbi:hypothetical protein [Halpernia frigidisoli]|uniref:Tetratricopeptide repeat protein n=1 Tax=Halpernia frigidisoli TaxID=1125876 RepID=A0A1I3I0W0_9FLAO|nr:hypothetical protein [Halpernia frigidisoli]SFI41473.1 hypothetical protein SAMN05443292_2498 [Halpernia frigidisoli]